MREEKKNNKMTDTPFTTALEFSKTEKTRLALIQKFCNEQQNWLGSGQYGSVFRGKYEGQDVAIKKINRLFNRSSLEVEVMDRLPNNKNVIKFIHMEEDRECRYIVMELAAATMAQLFIEDCKYSGPLPSDLGVIQQIANGLAFLHSKQIVHGDVKPENILISLDTPIQMKLSDFGFSKQIVRRFKEGIEHESSSPMSKGVDCAVSYTLSCVRGTPIWMAPELHSISERLTAKQLKAAQKEEGNSIKVSTAVDMYSFGLVSFYYLTKGVHPFGSISTKKQRALIPPRIIESNSVLPENLKKLSSDHPARNIVLQMMEHDEKQRITAPGVILKLNPMIGVNHIGIHHPFSDTPKITQSGDINKEQDDDRQQCCWDHLLNKEEWATSFVATSDSFWSSDISDESEEDITLFSALKESDILEECNNKVTEWIKRAVRTYCKDYYIKVPPSKPLIFFEMNELMSKVGLLFPITDYSLIAHSNMEVEDEMDNFYGCLHRDFSGESIAALIQFLSSEPSNDLLTATCLYYYRSENLKDVLRCLLLSNQIDVNATTNDGLNALHLACRDFSGEKLIEIVHLLVDHKINVNAQINEDSNALHLLLANQKNVIGEDRMVYLVKLIINSTNVNARNREGFNILNFLCKNCIDINKASWMMNMIQLLIDYSVDVNCKTNEEWNAVDYLCRHYLGDNLDEIIQLLIQNGLDVTVKRANGLNALTTCCRYYLHDHLIKVVQLLLENGIDVNAKMGSGPNALIRLCVYYHRENLVEIIQLLLKNGIQVNHTTNDGFNVLTALCHYYKGDNLIQLVRPLIEDHQIDVKVLASDRQTTLMKLCGHYSKPDLLNIVQLLIDNKIDLNAVDHEGVNALILLCRNYTGQNLSPIVGLLLKHKIDVNTTSKNGWNALLTVVRYYSSGDGLMEIVRLLIDHKIDVNFKNDEGNALNLLIRFYRGPKVMDIVNILLHSGINVNEKDKLGQNSLMIAVRYCSNSNLLMEIAQSLIEKNINTDCKTEDGNWNALHILCRYYGGTDHLAGIIRLLIEKGKIDATAKYSNFNWNALMTVCRYYGGDDLFEVITLLIDAGIDLGATNGDGSNALHLICQHYRGSDLLAIVRLLVGRANNSSSIRLDVGKGDYLGRAAMNMLLLFNRDLDRSDVKLFLEEEQLRNWKRPNT